MAKKQFETSKSHKIQFFAPLDSVFHVLLSKGWTVYFRKQIYLYLHHAIRPAQKIQSA